MQDSLANRAELGSVLVYGEYTEQCIGRGGEYVYEYLEGGGGGGLSTRVLGRGGGNEYKY